MGGPEDYKQFDVSSIGTTESTPGTITLGKHTYRKRDLLLGGIAILALLAVVVLAIVLAVEVSQNADKQSPGVVDQATVEALVSGKYTCNTPKCLKAAYQSVETMNTDANPCEDFYEYACGRYAVEHQQTPFMEDVQPVNEVNWKNLERIVYLLASPVQRDTEHSYERKAKHFMQSCTNHFDKMDLRGRPFVDHVVSKTPGWFLFNKFDESKFDLQASLKQVHIDFWTDAFFTVYVVPHMKDWRKSIVQLQWSGLGLPDLRYYEVPEAETYYKAYITYLATILVFDYDARNPSGNDVIRQFAEDAFEVEKAVAQTHMYSYYIFDPHSDENLATLDQINTDLNKTLDFIDYFKTMFNQHPGLFTAQTQIGVSKEFFFKNLGNMFSYYLNGQDGKRKLHNYLMWQLLSRYAHELSWDYVHAKRKLHHLMAGYKDDGDGYIQCITSVEYLMTDAMGAMFVNHFVKDATRQEGTRMMNKIKDQLVATIGKFDWMTEKNKKEATNKIQRSLYKVGFPDLLANEAELDKLYQNAEMSDTDYFGNVLALNEINRQQMNAALGNPDDRSTWRYHVWMPALEYYNIWHEMTVTYGMLQNPLFIGQGGPAYYKYGGVGSLMAEHLLHAIDQYGSYYSLDRSQFESWWDNATLNKYKEARECAFQSSKDLTYGPYKDYDGQNITWINSTEISQFYTPILLAEATGLRLSLQAYMSESKGRERLPVVTKGQTAEKLFFLAYAQTHCQNTPDYIKANALNNLRMPGKYRVNLALAHVPEFSKAFNCPATSALGKPNKCLLFPK